ncbi:hypothetical protein L228DRAFT_265353 [Xylona heveae TC161]|uniref:AGC-kinase C-terminal domain-containing protein n=1 Tax=Xylona heveae (strain CBS 132557 / TC161) TaxID=1328760 RepID=A0A165IFX1_XYLHT|nr:hypothetical protein L228DRAFT_265353 [Xylona heveae TC161]KZF24841.1 hypothetical protein L228DRAFT_265353 [Xylona heveae TC161]
MAPPAVFSYLRPHHKRDKTQSSSASQVQPPLAYETPLQTTGPFAPGVPPPQVPDNDSLHSSSPISPKQPVLPPTPRISSRHEPPRGSAAIELSAQGPAVQGSDEQQADVNLSKGPSAPTESSRVPDELNGLRHNDMGHPLAHESSSQESKDRPDTRGSTHTGSSHESQPRPPLNQFSFSASKVFQAYRRPSSPATAQSSGSAAGGPKASATNSSTQPHKLGKGKLNLLNPMSLLMRRRSSQAVANLAGDGLVNNRNYPMPSMGLPDDYDPRIRGKVVHDFSAPRPRRFISYGANSPDPGQQHRPESNPRPESSTYGDNGQVKLDGEQDPLAGQHFQSVASPMDSAPDNQWHQTSQAYQHSAQQSHSSLIRDLPVQPPTLGTPFSETPEIPYSNMPESETPVAEVTAKGDPGREENNSTGHQPTSRQPSVVESRFKSLGLPTHMTSNASRFSFDMNGVGSAAQEKLLEEKHKRRAALTKAAAPQDADGNYDEFDDGPEDMYDFDDSGEGVLEEEVPEFDVDADDIGEVGAVQGFGEFDFSSPHVAESPQDPQPLPGPTDTPLDNDGKAIGVAVSNEAPPALHIGEESVLLEQAERSSGAHGLGLHLDLSQLPGGNSPGDMDVPVNTATSHMTEAEDDLYFDDGLIEAPPEGPSGAFDESVFDDENSHLYSRKKSGVKPGNASEGPDGPSEPTGSTTVVNTNLPSSSLSFNGEASADGKGYTTPPLQEPAATSDPAQLAREKLAAYHDALAAAANKAVAEGKFDRRSSIEMSPSDQHQSPHSINCSDKSGIVLDDGHYSQEVLFSDPGAFEDTDDDFDFDAAMEDDPMIAAANAEALANDAEGIYGQEFGFYAQDCGSSDVEYFNGGYFGPRGMDGPIRSHSGRIAFREPNLTPITERSEYSNRNSLVSLSMHGAPQSAHALPSPGLAQLAGMMTPSFEEEEMSLSALMKLRRGAWGGSNGSLRSAASGGSQPSASAHISSNNTSILSPQQPGTIDSHSLKNPSEYAHVLAAPDTSSISPSSSFEYDFSGDEDQDELEAHGFQTGFDPHYNQIAAQSPVAAAAAVATPSTNIPALSPADRPTHYSWAPGSNLAVASNALASKVTTSGAQRRSFGSDKSVTSPILSPTSPAISEPIMSAAQYPWSVAPAVKAPQLPQQQHHHHHHRSNSGTGTERVSYRKEEDESGCDRWVLERRRTDEMGGMEIIEREVVKGGRI